MEKNSWKSRGAGT